MKRYQIFFLCILLFSASCSKINSESQEGKFNSSYLGENLNRLAFPIGGIGAGMICLEGTGAISHVSVRNHPDVFNEPFVVKYVDTPFLLNL